MITPLFNLSDLPEDCRALTRRELVETSAEGERVRLYLGERFAGIGRMQGDTMKFDAMLLE